MLARHPSGSSVSPSGSNRPTPPTTANVSQSQRSAQSTPRQSLNVSNNMNHSGRRRSSDTNTTHNNSYTNSTSYSTSYNNNNYNSVVSRPEEKEDEDYDASSTVDTRPSAQAHYDRMVQELTKGSGVGTATASGRPVTGNEGTLSYNTAVEQGQLFNTLTSNNDPQRLFSQTLGSVYAVPRPPPPAPLRKLADSHKALSPRRYGNAAERVESYAQRNVPYADHVYELQRKHKGDYSNAMHVFNETLQTHVRHRLETLAAESEAYNEEIRAKNGLQPLPPVRQPFARGYEVEEPANGGQQSAKSSGAQVVLYDTQHSASSEVYQLPSPRQRVLSREVQQRLTSPRADAYRAKALPQASTGAADGSTTPTHLPTTLQNKTQAHYNAFKNMPREVMLLSPRAREAVAKRNEKALVIVSEGSDGNDVTASNSQRPSPSGGSERISPPRMPHHSLVYYYGKKKHNVRSPRSNKREKESKPYTYPSTSAVLRANAENANKPAISPAKLAYLESLSTTQTIKERLKRLMEEETLRAQRKQEKWDRDAIRVDDLRQRRRNPLREEAIDRITGRRPLSNTRVSLPVSPLTSASSRPHTGGGLRPTSDLTTSSNAYNSSLALRGNNNHPYSPHPLEEESYRKEQDEEIDAEEGTDYLDSGAEGTVEVAKAQEEEEEEAVGVAGLLADSE